MIKVALDAMGGDHAPSLVVEGAVMAAKESAGRFHVVLCGPEAEIRAELTRLGYSGDAISIVNAPELVAMDESPTQVLKTKQNSGLVVCVGLQKKGLVQASVSAGNSGAMMASCLMILGRSASITRPAIALNMPNHKGPCVMLDMGANVDEKPQTLVDFAHCGSVYAEAMYGIAQPRVALLNMGEEEKKGTEAVQEAHKMLKNSGLNFIGNVEGRDILAGMADVIVTPGFTGNIVLKLIEGFHELHTELFGRIDTPAGREFDKQWDYRTHGGGLLLGLNGTGIIAHGRSDALAIKNAVVTAYQLAEAKVSEKIGQRLSIQNS
ncbi:MAG TPA: phosphate acyltransferase PlsX [Fibrobacteraceae bacterium]|nr:phosphate acyltransferase PlsX [Fibrobacteraceae bacterium]